MQESKSIKINFIFNVILKVSTLLFPLITFPYISRSLLPEGVGKVSFAVSFVAYFSLFAQLGVPTYGIREVAKHKDNREELSRVFFELLTIEMIFTVISYVIFILSLFLFPRLKDDRILFLIISLTIILNSFGVEWFYKGLEYFKYITVRSVVFKAIALVAVFLFIKKPEDYLIYGFISIFASSASNILNFYNVFHHIDISPKYFSLHFIKHLKSIYVFFAITAATTLYTNLDTVMLGFMTTDEDVGFYNTATKIKMVLVMVVASLGTVLLPRNSYYIKNKLFDKFWDVTKKSLYFTITISLPLIVFFTVFAKESIICLAGNSFYDSIVPMQIIMPTVLFIGLTNVLGTQILTPFRMEKVVLYSVVVGAIADMILNLILIPKYRSSGASIGTLIAEIIVFLWQCSFLHHKSKLLFRSIPFWQILTGIAISILVSYPVKYLPLGNFMKLAISSCVFWGLYFVILLFFKNPFATFITGFIGKYISPQKCR